MVVVMDYCKDTLATEISERLNQSYFYDESEIWYALERIMMVENDLTKNYGRVHGDMQPGNIIVPDDESIKFIDPTLIHFKMNGFMRTRLGMETAPLSPEQMSALRSNRDPTGDQQASEVWSIGMLIGKAKNL
jgi:5-methylthioribose kinase